jgi:hypothetical protein
VLAPGCGGAGGDRPRQLDALDTHGIDVGVALPSVAAVERRGIWIEPIVEKAILEACGRQVAARVHLTIG